MPFGKKKEPKEPKEKKEKKPKKPKKPKKEKVPKEKKPKDPKKKKSPVKLLILLAAVAAVAVVAFLFLGPKGEEEEGPKLPELPSEYAVGDLTVVGMAVDETEDQVQAIRAKTVVYTYTDLKDSGAAAEGYVSQLAAETPRFSVVDEEFVRTDKPDFTAQEGTVLMARNIEPAASAQTAADGSQAEAVPEVSKVLTVKIEWSVGTCVVTADEAEGTVTSPPPPPQSETSSGGSIGIYEATDRLKSISPEKLGLSGASMDEYEIFPLDGMVMLDDDRSCIRVNVYSRRDAQSGNEFMGSYLMSTDGQSLYRLDPVTNKVEEIEDFN